ncbi:universal stress protein [Falsiroseomonas tokyonensis]|uniref:Universal stress protein n=1 Tax=Falsiroseomonas tokyonensis TaxID=430521 RepID=A0ABV7C3E2_9PROT|nr:universal stress protein [Falsiroseomonas tokyonensis]MBU8541407.1 universal stress protein [Falsiroseomonas tokyonensis]
MAIKDILVHLDAAPASAARLDFAADLALRHAAHLVGLHVIDILLPVFAGAEIGGGAVMAEMITQMEADAVVAARPVEAAFRERLRRDELSGEWRQVSGSLPSQLALHGRYADLVVMGQAEPDSPSPAGSAAVQAALFESGRPVLLLPHSGAPHRLGRRALVAWNARREAARAVHDALPLFAGMREVIVLTVAPELGMNGHGEQPGADIAAHLARHGLKVTVRLAPGSDVAAGEVLLNEAADLGADLLVMGGYGHSRFREFVLGGVTRTVLKQMTLPVLMSH